MSASTKSGWFVSDAKPVGPLAPADVVARLRDGRIAPSAWIWVPEVGAWAPAKAVLDEMTREGPEQPLPRPAPTAAPLRDVVFRSLRMVVTSLAIAFGIVYLFWALFPSDEPIGAIVAAAFAVAWLYNEARGVRVGPEGISAPRRFPGPLRGLSITRRVILPDNDCEMYCRKSLGFEVVWVVGRGMKETLLFDNQKQRRQFIEAIKRRFPNVQVHRDFRPTGVNFLKSVG
jgi:hypothetical protein